MTSHISKAVAVATAFFCFPTVGAASGDDKQEDKNSSWYHDAAAVPFAFSTDSMGFLITFLVRVLEMILVLMMPLSPMPMKLGIN